MSMSSKRLGLLVKVAEVRTDQAATELSRKQQCLAEQQQRLDELRAYIADYRAGPIPMSAVLLDNRERFLARLAEAEAQQLRAVTQGRAAVTDYTARWHTQRRSGDTYNSLHEDARGREDRVQEKQNQSRLDDFAMRGFMAQRAALGDG